MSTQALVQFDYRTHRFENATPHDAPILASTLDRPLSVIVQVTRRCHLDCVFCSETQNVPDPALSTLERMADHLLGVPRVYLSGGEPLMRRDLPEILRLFAGRFIVGLPTNALAPHHVMRTLKSTIAFATVGLDGPRTITSRVRGDYDAIMRGLDRFRAWKIPLSLSCVVLASTADAVPFTCQIADVVGAAKVKLILPIPKGNALNLPAYEYLSADRALAVFEHARNEKERFGWSPTLTMTIWSPANEGYSILVYPDGETFAWPVFDAPDKVHLLGNLIDEEITTLWERNPYKLNHVRKYLGHSICIA